MLKIAQAKKYWSCNGFEPTKWRFGKNWVSYAQYLFKYPTRTPMEVNDLSHNNLSILGERQRTLQMKN